MTASTDAVRVTRLASGLTVVTEEMPRVGTVSFGAYVAAGSRHESAEENGVSHFLEHMAFKGTERRTALAIAEAVEDVGGHINAYTAREQTAYFVKLLREDLPLGMDIIGDILCHSTFLPEELERERGVILQEIGQTEDTPDDIVFDHFQAAAYPDQPLGRPILGGEEIIRGMRRASLTGYMKRHYAPGNMVLAAAGNLTHEAVLALAEEHFSRLPGESPLPAPRGEYRGGEYREEKDLEQVHIALGFPCPAYADPDFHAGQLLAAILGGGMSSRLFQEIREKRGLVYAVQAFTSPYKDGGLFQVYAGTGETEAEELMPVMVDELRKVQDDVSEDELRRARAQAKAGLLMSLESTGSRSEQLGRQLQVFGRVIPVEESVARLEAVSVADVTRVARRLFSAPPTLATMGPVGRVMPCGAIGERLAA